MQGLNLQSLLSKDDVVAQRQGIKTNSQAWPTEQAKSDVSAAQLSPPSKTWNQPGPNGTASGELIMYPIQGNAD